MRTWTVNRAKWKPGAVVLAAAILAAMSGCLGEPQIDKRWTLLEMLESEPQSQASVSSDAGIAVHVKGRITYRAIQTGYLVAELRYSRNVSPETVALDPTVHDLDQAQQVDLVLENSVTAGRATRAVTGFDHLMQDFDLDFQGSVPDAMTASYPDSGMMGGLFLLLYMAEGDEIELPTGRDTLIVTPYLSRDHEILGCGLELQVIAPGAATP